MYRHQKVMMRESWHLRIKQMTFMNLLEEHKIIMVSKDM